MAATIRVLQDILWESNKPELWTDLEEEQWKLPVAPGEAELGEELIACLTNDIKEMVWKKAAQHRNGAGLEQGTDWKVMRKQLKIM